MSTKVKIESFVSGDPAAILVNLFDNQEVALTVMASAIACADALAEASTLSHEQARNAIVLEGFTPERQVFSFNLKMSGTEAPIRVSRHGGEQEWLIDGPSPVFEGKAKDEAQDRSRELEMVLSYERANSEDLPALFVECVRRVYPLVQKKAA